MNECNVSADPLYRAGFIQNASMSQAYGKNPVHSIANIPQIANGSSSAYYNSVIQHQVQQSHQGSPNYFVSGRNNANHRFNSKAQQHEVGNRVNFVLFFPNFPMGIACT